MATTPKILVFGSTGTVGSEVVKALNRHNVPIRAAVHNVDKAGAIKSGHAHNEVVQIEIYNPDSIAKALEGIEKVFLLTPPGQTSAGYGIVDAIKKNGHIKQIVKLSALGSEEPGDAFVWAKEHATLEEAIHKAGIPLTSLRPSSFHSNAWQDVPTIKSQGVIYKALGDTPINMISNVDIGEVAAIALTQPGHDGKIYNLTGPDTMNQTEYAKLLSEVLGKEIKYHPMSEDDNRKAAAGFLPPQAIDAWVNMYQYFKNGGYNRSYPDLEKILGRKGKTIRSFLEENKAGFA